jgi:hypothetical protein
LSRNIISGSASPRHQWSWIQYQSSIILGLGWQEYKTATVWIVQPPRPFTADQRGKARIKPKSTGKPNLPLITQITLILADKELPDCVSQAALPLPFIPRSKGLTQSIPIDTRAAQHRGPRQARSWPDGVEAPSAVGLSLLRSPDLPITRSPDHQIRRWGPSPLIPRSTFPPHPKV